MAIARHNLLETGRGPFLIRSKPKTTKAYETYWKFAALRQEIFFDRLESRTYKKRSTDQILRDFKFTNAYRAADRVSQYLIRNVIYKGDQSTEEVFFRTILFKIFNRIDTWELFQEELGEVSWREFEVRRYDDILSGEFAKGRKIYSAAYIMPSAGGAFGQKRKHSNHLMLIHKMMDDRLALRVQQCPSMSDVFELLLSYHGIGRFLAYQYTIDLNYSEITNFSEDDFVVAGPGALSGISKCFEELGGWTPEDVISFMTDRQEQEFDEQGGGFKNLWGRRLHKIDCQNLFCEVDKYSRIAHPDINGIGNRTRIKQGFRPSAQAISYWFPPKWKINENLG